MFRTPCQIILLFCSLSFVKGGDLPFTYIENGADWPNDFPDCAGPN